MGLDLDFAIPFCFRFMARLLKLQVAVIIPPVATSNRALYIFALVDVLS